MFAAQLSSNDITTLRPIDVMESVLERLQADPEDDWMYTLEERGKLAAIRVHDETGEFVGYL